MEILVYEKNFLIALLKSFEFPVKKTWSRISGKLLVICVLGLYSSYFPITTGSEIHWLAASTAIFLLEV